ncbi:hypothetical protein ACN077_17600 [Clostridium chromiireducens]|uniref:hypothetical protein n=1 Tax=Clostridium chromiireducens TaxID=225345 RepID=UPI003AF9CFB8
MFTDRFSPSVFFYYNVIDFNQYIFIAVKNIVFKRGFMTNTSERASYFKAEVLICAIGETMESN